MNAYELAAVMAAKETFARLLEGRRAVVFVDNTVALHSLVKGYARKGDLCSLVAQLWMALAEKDTQVWFEWVKSAANLADGPSRGDFSILEELGYRPVKVLWPRGLLLPTRG